MTAPHTFFFITVPITYFFFILFIVGSLDSEYIDINQIMQHGYAELKFIIDWAKKVPGIYHQFTLYIIEKFKNRFFLHILIYSIIQ